MPTAAQINPLRSNLATVTRLARRELDAFWATLDMQNMVEGRRALEEFFPILVEQYGNVASIVAADWYEDVYQEHSTLVNADVNTDQVNARMRWAITQAFGGDANQALATLGMVTDELVKQFGRDTVQLSAGSNGRRFARVPTGSETCDFCIAMASRGFVYKTQSNAGEMSKFHGDCDCAIVADDGVIPEGYDTDELYEQYMSGSFYRRYVSSRENLRTVRLR